MSISSSAVF
jgi:hypothetical protein